MDVFAALADPVRRHLLRQLCAGPARVVDLTARQSISRPAISRHLRVLQEAGLVTATTSGRERYYRLADPAALHPVRSLLGQLEQGSPRRWDQALDALETEVRRTRRERRHAGTIPARGEEIA